jgi:YaiO family outer membrane protein
MELKGKNIFLCTMGYALKVWMKHLYMNKLCLIIFLNMFLFTESFGQINTDSLFQSSVQYAALKQYDSAVAEAQKVLEIHPDRADVMIHIANVYAWQQKTDSAKIYIQQAYALAPQSKELYDSWLNILLWNKEYEEIHTLSALAFSNKYPDSTNIALKRLIAYKGSEKYEDGLNYADSLQNTIRKHPPVKALIDELILLIKNRQLSVFYSLDFFEKNNPEPQHLLFIDYAFKTGKHTWILRFNYANRFSKSDLMIESDYYHILKKKKYLYFNYGYSLQNELFPRHRAGFEYYFPLFRVFDASLGGRYLAFQNPDVYILSGHLGKQWGSFWLAARPFYVFTENRNAFSLVNSFRLYGNNFSDFWGLEFSYGNSPDDRNLISNSGDIFRLSAYRIKVEKSFFINARNNIRIASGYSYEEFNKNAFRNKYLAEIHYTYRF